MSEDYSKTEAFEEEAAQNQGPGKPGPGWKSLLFLGLAVILILVLVNNQFTVCSSASAGRLLAPGSCCGGGARERTLASSCCGGGGGTVTQEQAARAGLDYYRANFGDEDVETVVEDFGCHQEIVIYRDKEMVKRFSFSNGTIYELTP